MKNPIRWNRLDAAAEFGIDRDTLSRRLRAAGIAPGEDKRFSTKEILAALFGDLEKEKTRNEAAKADLHEMKRDLDASRLIPAEVARASMHKLTGGIMVVISASPLTAKQQAAIAGNLDRLNNLFA